jgi:mono/diheme cytochrome c family protein
VIQALMTLNTLKAADAPTYIKSASQNNKTKGVQLVTARLLAPPTAGGRGGNMMEGIAPYTPEELSTLQKGEQIYTQVCFACHGDDGRGARTPGSQDGPMLGPPLAASPRVLGHSDYAIRVLLHGLNGPINGTTYPDVMISMGQNNDEWVGAILSYVRNSFGNRASFVTAAQVARNRAATADRKTPWTVAELDASLPRVIVADPSWKLSASHNSPTASNAMTIQPWTTGQPQQAGMWFQVEMTQPALITQIQFESPGVVADAGPAIPGAPTRTGIGRGSAPPSAPGVPIAYDVQTSMDGTTWSTPVAQGKGAGDNADIAFAPVRAKFIRITQTGTADNAPPWAIRRLRLYEAGAATTAAR